MARRKYFTETRVAGFKYHEGLLCYDELKVGAELTMVREADNSYDHNAVAFYRGDCKIGYIPRGENEQFATFFDLNHSDLFEARINKVDEDAHSENRIGVTIFLKERE
ncbi:MAG: HIRAN domain-containing protein [Bacteroidaceae bacterium]|nr:HIRAN domain-containing protein [Bacteroidaceae bacterium]